MQTHGSPANTVAVLEGRYVDPVAGRVSFGHFAKKWLDGRHDLRPKTRELYEGLLRRWIVPQSPADRDVANSSWAPCVIGTAASQAPMVQDGRPQPSPTVSSVRS